MPRLPVALSLLVLASPAWAQSAAEPSLPIVERAIDRGLAWIASQPGLEVGDVFVLQQLDRAAALDRAAKEVAERAGSMGPFEGLVRPGAMAVQPEEWASLRGQRYEPLPRWLYHAANAPGVAVPESVMAELLKGDHAEYLLAHQVLALRLLGERGVIAGPGFEARMRSLLDQVEAEQRADSAFSDLFAEREALLLSAGRVSSETPRRIARILSSQSEDGHWRVPRHPYPTTIDEKHCTLVSLWALDEHARTLKTPAKN